ncbi:MAG: signal recognition particle receptor subunit alpha, partial [Clostridia bacterium]|nr:signal recognition particle receptor subunit alpha [Clostridia bacterium]
MGLFSKIKEGLFKTRGNMGAKMDELVENTKKIDDDFFDDLIDIMIMSDVGVKTAEEAVNKLREKCENENITDAGKAKSEFAKIMADMMRDQPMKLENPSVLFIIGVNGVGKTTSIGKLAARMKLIGRRVMIVAGDTFRAAAAEQLTVWAERADVPIIKRGEGADPASVVFDGIQAAKAKHADVLIVDTAGRLHNKAHLMEELKKMARIVSRE